ncbi:gluconate 2-dehydrogenase subunit 3 family protein [Chitinophaga filiformis]|uniref:Gluconate 2-dehydrogenase subunit 3 family protein n=1 Tax=Chitinophaga filiformis TaxID=104663 RepID=A0ABY4HU40_CHIFI|nr:gluconate 2-dehydrogenase subunit 3 family protein [Chitinophaga filiformis]UPK67112.1 gluconate 2-dehydrogenase subunit 3 family protein [Chitinophaga filiformis]
MNRRKALGNIMLLAGAGAAAWSGIRLGKLYSTPNLGKLQAHAALITELAETIIPATDTPGAKAAGVTPFIIRMIRDCTPRKEQNRFLMGLDEVEDYAKRHYNHSFARCNIEQRLAIADHFERRDRPYKGITGKISHKVMGDPFFVIMKKYTVIGYCSSMEGATRGLVYDYVPGHYAGAVRLKPGQKAWATE